VRLSVLASAFAALLLVIVWLSVFAVLASKRNDALEAERRQNVNVANVLGEQTLRVIATLDQACRGWRRRRRSPTRSPT
jgi:ABC-type dipeptide/oligopeptide/nickel transport system permease subunit